ncbi:MAG: hypothetical protein HY905_04580 [Deltaproteobacteria bacterium]|nr:hypothetical protein [Deltaproteobacteria bacterium]
MRFNGWTAIFATMLAAGCPSRPNVSVPIGRTAPVSGAGGTAVLIGEPAAEGEAGADDAREASPEDESRLRLVVDAPYQSWAGDGTYVHLVAFTPDFEPAAGAAVFLDGRKIGRTDDSGTLVFRQEPRGEEFPAGGLIRVEWHDRVAEVSYQAYARTSSFEQPTVYVYADRGVYNPGQTIHVRALAWKLRGEYRPLAEARVELHLEDDDGRIVGGGVMTTDRWGVGTLDLPLPRHADEGRYGLAAIFEGERAEADVRLERFVPPAIEIRHDLGRFLTPAVDELPFEVTLGMFGGGAFGRGELTITVAVDGTEVHRESREVEGAGPHRFVLGGEPLRAIRDRAGDGSIVGVTIRAQDEHERSDQVRRDLRWETNPYIAVIELDRTRYAPGDPVKAMVRLVDLDHVPVRDRRVRLEVEGSVHPLEETTDEGGLASFAFDMPDVELGAWVPVSAWVDDVDSAVAYADLPCESPVPMRSAVPDTVASEGEDVSIEVVFPGDIEPVEAVVHADVVDSSGAIVHSFLIPIFEEEGEFVARTKTRATDWGSMLLTLFCLARDGGDVGLVTDGQNLAVHPDRALRITLDGIPDQAAPGDRFRVTADVRGPDGAPRDAVLGAAVVDAAVLSLLDPLERSPVDRFYNPERKVLASTGAQTLSWPVVQKNWGYDSYDIGWPATFGFHTGEGYGGYGYGAAFGYGGLGIMGTGEGGGGEYTVYESSYGPPPPEPVEPGQMQFEFSDDIVEGELIRPDGEMLMARLPSSHAGPGPSGDVRALEVRPQPRVIVRTDFAETALWLPRLEAPDGRGAFDVALPDSITVQEVSVVASDAEGGVGLARAQLPVRQPLYARSDLPASLIAGDRVKVGVAVRNLSAEAVKARVALASTELAVEGEAQELDVPADGTGVAWFEVTGGAPGEAAYEVSAESFGVPDPVRDVVRRTLFVRPAGASQVETVQGTAGPGAPFRHTVAAPAAGEYRVVRLGVSLPTVIPALQGLLDLLDEEYLGPDPAASRLLAVTAAMRWLERHDQLDEATRERMRTTLAELLAAILMAQNDDGGWGWFWDPGSVPFITAFVLHGLLELRELDFPVPDDALLAARDSLLAGLGPDHLFDVSGIAVWEGADERIRLEGTAEIFDVLTRLPAELRPSDERWTGLVGRMLETIDAPAPDLPTMAHSVGGLFRLGGDLVPAAKLRELAGRLLRLDELAHWEPGWFQAYGGRVEAAAVGLEVLSDVAPDAYESLRREAVGFLLSLDDTWGEWHNSRSAAFAIRALLALDPAPDGAAGAIVVSVDGREVRRVDVSPADSFADALALRSLELELAAGGGHEVSVAFDGRPEARVRLELERWAVADASASSSPAAGGRRLAVSRAAVGTMAPGVPATITLFAEAEGAVGPMVLVQRLPPFVHAERSSLDALVERGDVAGYDLVGDEVRIYVSIRARMEAAFRIAADREEEVTLPAAEALALFHADIRARTGTAHLSID